MARNQEAETPIASVEMLQVRIRQKPRARAWVYLSEGLARKLTDAQRENQLHTLLGEAANVDLYLRQDANGILLQRVVYDEGYETPDE